MNPEKKEFLTVTLPIMCSIIAAVFTAVVYMSGRMDRMDERWYLLLKEIHRIDKKVQKIEIETENYFNKRSP